MDQLRYRRLVNVTLLNTPIPLQLLLLPWVFVPVAISLAFTKRKEHRLIFAFSYIAIVPCASTLDLTGQELARTLSRVADIAVETLLGTVVEMVLSIVLIARPNEHGNSVTVMKAVILGSIPTNMLLCLGLCSLIGGMRYQDQKFHSLVGGISPSVLLGVEIAMLLPATFFYALYSSATSVQSDYSLEQHSSDTLAFDRATAVILLSTFLVHMYYNTQAKRTLLDQILKNEEEEKPADKITLIVRLLLASISLGFVFFLAYILARKFTQSCNRDPSRRTSWPLSLCRWWRRWLSISLL